jgi:hypothetical protein
VGATPRPRYLERDARRFSPGEFALLQASRRLPPATNSMTS